MDWGPHPVKSGQHHSTEAWDIIAGILPQKALFQLGELCWFTLW